MEIQKVSAALDFLGNLVLKWQQGDENYTYHIYSAKPFPEIYERMKNVVGSKFPITEINNLYESGLVPLTLSKEYKAMREEEMKNPIIIPDMLKC